MDKNMKELKKVAMFVLLLLVLSVVLMLTEGCTREYHGSIINAHAAPMDVLHTGGDCHAQLARGDTYVAEVDESCVVVPGADYLVEDEIKSHPDNTYTPPTRIPEIPAPTQIVPTPMPTEPPVVITPEPLPTKQHCNKGSGNGGEGCDPGNHPEKGNDDEGGGKDKKDKKDK